MTIGAISAWFTQPRYRYTCSIQIGQIGGEPVEGSESVASKLKNAYVPAALSKYMAEHPHDKYSYKVRVSSEPKSDVVVLMGTGPKSAEDGYIEIMHSAVAKISKDEEAIVGPVRRRHEAEARRAQIELQKLKNEKVFSAEVMTLKSRLLRGQSRLADLKGNENVLKVRIDRHDSMVKLVSAEIVELKHRVNRQAEDRARFLQHRVSDPAQVLAALLMDARLDRASKQLLQLKERRDVTLPIQRQALISQVASNQRAQRDQESQIAALQAQLTSLYLTHKTDVAAKEQMVASLEADAAQVQGISVIQDAGRLPAPVGPSKAGKITLASIAGLVLGVLLAFGVELFATARTKRA